MQKQRTKTAKTRDQILRLALASALMLSACSTSTAVHTPAARQAEPATRAAAAAYDYNFNIFHPIVADNGMVVSEQRLASEVGLDVLKRGGNAVDAAVAMGFALSVTLPYSGNTGGGGFMMVHNAVTREDVALDFREEAPLAASSDMYLNAQGKVINGMSLHSHAAVAVPGTVAGLTHALQRWGSLPLSQLLQPAIDYAENGYPVSKTLAAVLQRTRNHLAKWPATRSIFFKDGEPLKHGDMLVQKDLAESLQLIARDGASAFYHGPIADKITAEMARHGGLITHQDLTNYRVIEREPIRGSYRGYDIVTAPPPSSGGIHIVQLLHMMEHWPLREWGHNSARSVHHMAEAMKLVYADRSEYLGDTDFVQVPVRGLLSKGYAARLVQKIKDDSTLTSSSVKPGNPHLFNESDNTTHYSVMDSQGNMVAVTYTLNTNFGSGIVAEGTGIMLNNEMDDFSAKPGVPNAYGLIGGEANAIQPRKRPLSSMSPTFVLKDGKPWLVTGSPGGARIITTVLQILSNAIDHDMDPAAATVAPRFHQQWTPDEIRVEQGFPVDTISLLRQRGERVVVKPAMGRAQTIQIRNGQLLGFSDPRNPDGAALGY